jgi:hypothetical protein
MKEYQRTYPLFSLCGLKCGLCPRYHTDGDSKCPGCGGKDFYLKHPSCKVINCNQKHDKLEFCHQCSTYPCDKYSKPSKVDSFITYKNVQSDFEKLKKLGLNEFKKEINRKVEILELLLKNYNDGKRKSFYCLAVNLIDLNDLEKIVEQIENETNLKGKEKILFIVELIKTIAQKREISLELRK